MHLITACTSIHPPLRCVALALSRLELVLPHPVRGKLADKVLVQFIEADVDIGFGLLDEAMAFIASGHPDLSLRLLQEAAGVVADIERRLQRLSESESRPFHPLLAELRSQIAAAERETSQEHQPGRPKGRPPTLYGLLRGACKPMEIERRVANHYTRENLEDKILGLMRSAGKNLDQLRVDDIAAVDEFHLGGREATQALAEFMHLRPNMHLLDVGCGIGGPARYFAERGCQVTGIDLTEDFIRVAESLTRKVKLEQKAQFRQGSALALPFAADSFDGAYTIHVCMNIADKAGVFRETARVLKPGARFTVYDIMRASDGTLGFPVPWAQTPETSFLATVNDYRQGLQAAGFRIEHQRDRRQFALEFMQRMMAQSASGPPLLSVNVLMGEQAPVMLKNVNMAIASGVLAPMEIVAVAP